MIGKGKQKSLNACVRVTLCTIPIRHVQYSNFNNFFRNNCKIDDLVIIIYYNIKLKIGTIFTEMAILMTYAASGISFILHKMHLSVNFSG